MSDPVAESVVVVVPLFNEAPNVAPVAGEVRAAFDRVSLPWELVLVDDGSTDGTWEGIRALAPGPGRIRGLRHGRNRGQSAAVWTGIQRSDAPWICTLDGDLQNDPADLPPLLERLRTDGWDCVSGHRVDRQDAWLRRVSSVVARRARARVLGADFADTGCGLRVFRRSALEGLLPFNGWHRFLPVLLAANGWRCLEVPVRHRARRAGVSKYGVGNRLWRGLFDLMGVAWYQRRLLPRGPVEEWDPEGGLRCPGPPPGHP